MGVKFIHITDTHLVEQGQVLYGLNPYNRLERCLDSVIQDHPDAALCVLTGDLAHVGHSDAYRQLAQQLGRLPMPVLPILGNHDNRSNFREYFPQIETDANGFVQYEAPVGSYRGLFLDTNEPGVSYGVLCDKRARWLAERLAADERPVLLFMHHPAFVLGIAAMDRIALLETGPFLEALQGQEQRVKHLFFGHLHRPIFGSWRGIPFSTLRGTNHQVALRLDDTAKVPGSHEPPQYGVVLLGEDSITVHLHDFLDISARFWL
jgi:3',5'-cyclic AMP phosphodiesterase CpdA